jgi:hypothetical protein
MARSAAGRDVSLMAGQAAFRYGRAWVGNRTRPQAYAHGKQASSGALAHQDGDDREEDDAGRARRRCRHPREDNPEPARRAPGARPDLVRRVHGAGARFRTGEGGLESRWRGRARRAGAQRSRRPRRTRLHGCVYPRRRRPLHRQLSHPPPVVLGDGRHHGLSHRHQLGRRMAEPPLPGARPAGQAVPASRAALYSCIVHVHSPSR